MFLSDVGQTGLVHVQQEAFSLPMSVYRLRPPTPLTSGTAEKPVHSVVLYQVIGMAGVQRPAAVSCPSAEAVVVFAEMRSDYTLDPKQLRRDGCAVRRTSKLAMFMDRTPRHASECLVNISHVRCHRRSRRGGRSEKARGGCDPAAGAPCPLFSPHRCERHEDVDRNHLSPFIQPLLPPARGPIHSRCLGRDSNRAAGFAEVDAFWRQTRSWLALPPRCICDPVASPCAVFDERCCPARPDSACCAASRAAPLAALHWPLPLGQWQGWLGAYLRGNVGQVPSPPSPDGSLPSGEPEVQKRAPR